MAILHANQQARRQKVRMACMKVVNNNCLQYFWCYDCQQLVTLKAGRAPSLQSSCQALGCSHSGAGLGMLPGSLRPPVSRNIHSSSSTRPRLPIMREVRRKAKSSLSFSHSERHTLQ
eukprot:scaffold14228_cov40-Prasinocladus_malaysianus.AAC.1